MTQPELRLQMIALPLFCLALLAACARESGPDSLPVLPPEPATAPALPVTDTDFLPQAVPVPESLVPATPLDLSVPLPAPDAVDAWDGSRPLLLPSIESPQRRTRVSIEPFVREIRTDDNEKKFILDGGQLTIEHPLGPQP